MQPAINLQNFNLQVYNDRKTTFRVESHSISDCDFDGTRASGPTILLTKVDDRAFSALSCFPGLPTLTPILTLTLISTHPPPPLKSDDKSNGVHLSIFLSQPINHQTLQSTLSLFNPLHGFPASLRHTIPSVPSPSPWSPSPSPSPSLSLLNHSFIYSSHSPTSSTATDLAFPDSPIPAPERASKVPAGVLHTYLIVPDHLAGNARFCRYWFLLPPWHGWHYHGGAAGGILIGNYLTYLLGYKATDQQPRRLPTKIEGAVYSMYTYKGQGWGGMNTRVSPYLFSYLPQSQI